jgi:hypothetical protein
MTRLGAAVCAVVAIAGISLLPAGPAASSTTALQVAPIATPKRVHGSDGREHIAYDLAITSIFTTKVSLTSLEVRGGGKKLLGLSGDELAAAIRPFGGGGPTTSVPVSSTVVAAACRSPPTASRSRSIGSASRDPALRVRRRVSSR